MSARRRFARCSFYEGVMMMMMMMVQLDIYEVCMRNEDDDGEGGVWWKIFKVDDEEEL